METPHDGLEEVPPVKFGHLGGLAMINYTGMQALKHSSCMNIRTRFFIK